jgi:hypothetical protein
MLTEAAMLLLRAKEAIMPLALRSVMRPGATQMTLRMRSTMTDGGALKDLLRRQQHPRRRHQRAFWREQFVGWRQILIRTVRAAASADAYRRQPPR